MLTTDINTPISPKSANLVYQKEDDDHEVDSMLTAFKCLSTESRQHLLFSMIHQLDYPTLASLQEYMAHLLKRDFLSHLPLEISLHILSYLDLRSLLRVGQVSKSYHNLLSNHGAQFAIWKKKCVSEFNSTVDVVDYKSLYQYHDSIRRNWFLGKYSHISFPGHGSNVVTCLQFDADRIVSGSDDQTIHIYDTETGHLLRELKGHDGGVWALQYIQDTLVSGSTDRTVRVWDMESGKCTHIFDGHTSTVRCLMIIQPFDNEEESFIVTGSRDASLRVWKLPNPKTDAPWSPASGGENPFFVHTLSGHNNSVRAIAGHGKTLVSGSYDCTVRVWDVVTGECRHVLRGHREKVYSVGYSHELSRAVSGSMDTTVKVWCTNTGIMVFNLEGHTSLVGLLELSPQYLVSAAADSTLRIWDPVSGKCLGMLSGHNAAITCFNHDPKLNRIVSGSDGGIKVWELSSDGYGSTNSFASLNSQGIIPHTSTLGSQLSYKQGRDGPEPVYGRFIRDVVSHVQGVWRVRMDEKRLVCAVQREEGGTWFEVLNFAESVDSQFVQEDEDMPDATSVHWSDEESLSLLNSRWNSARRRSTLLESFTTPQTSSHELQIPISTTQMAASAPTESPAGNDI